MENFFSWSVVCYRYSLINHTPIILPWCDGKSAEITKYPFSYFCAVSSYLLFVKFDFLFLGRQIEYVWYSFIADACNCLLLFSTNIFNFVVDLCCSKKRIKLLRVDGLNRKNLRCCCIVVVHSRFLSNKFFQFYISSSVLYPGRTAKNETFNKGW